MDKRGDTACSSSSSSSSSSNSSSSSSSSGCADCMGQGSCIKAALFLICFPEKSRTRANIIMNSIISIPIDCNSFYSGPIQFLSIQLFSIPIQFLSNSHNKTVNHKIIRLMSIHGRNTACYVLMHLYNHYITLNGFDSPTCNVMKHAEIR